MLVIILATILDMVQCRVWFGLFSISLKMGLEVDVPQRDSRALFVWLEIF